MRSLTSYYKVQRLIAHSIRGRRWAVNWKHIQNKRLLDIGCGPNTHQDFINLDYGWHPGVNLCWDITRGLPIRSNSLEGIFTEHCLEHISVNHIIPILGECIRVLEPGGTIRIILPDGELYLKGYVALLQDKNATALPYAMRDRIDGLYSPIMSVNRIFRDEGHEFIYDFDCLVKLLERVGFQCIEKLSLGKSRNSKLLIDSRSRAIESLYIEAIKP
jgi:predicted SAM-dependent methyltransferase